MYGTWDALTNFLKQDAHRIAEINKEIGLDEVLRGIGMDKTPLRNNGDTSSSDGEEKKDAKQIEHSEKIEHAA